MVKTLLRYLSFTVSHIFKYLTIQDTKFNYFSFVINVLYLPKSYQQEIMLNKDQKYVIKMIFYELSANFLKLSNSRYFTISEKEKQISSAGSVFPVSNSASPNFTFWLPNRMKRLWAMIQIWTTTKSRFSRI